MRWAVGCGALGSGSPSSPLPLPSHGFLAAAVPRKPKGTDNCYSAIPFSRSTASSKTIEGGCGTTVVNVFGRPWKLARRIGGRPTQRLAAHDLASASGRPTQRTGGILSTRGTNTCSGGMRRTPRLHRSGKDAGLDLMAWPVGFPKRLVVGFVST